MNLRSALDLFFSVNYIFTDDPIWVGAVKTDSPKIGLISSSEVADYQCDVHTILSS